jgi:hypothetical protein
LGVEVPLDLHLPVLLVVQEALEEHLLSVHF